MAQPVSSQDLGLPEDGLLLGAAQVTVVNTGPALAPLVAALAEHGVGAIKLIGDAPVTDLDRQQSRHLLPSDVGRPSSEILEERVLVGRRTRLSKQPLVPQTAAEWRQALEGSSFVVAIIQGPILFYPWLDLLNEVTWSARIPWLSVALGDAREALIGPLVVPGSTACYKCYEMRYKSNLGSLDSYLVFEKFIHQTGEVHDLGFLPPLADIAAELAALEAVRALLPGQTSRTRGKLLTFDPYSFTLEQHAVLKLPRCQVCSPPRPAAQPVLGA